jgi:AcrR family transcriptional regulator
MMGDADSATPPSDPAGDRRQKLLLLAAELIAEKGIAACTFRKLAERAGTSTAPFTYAFGSRARMLAELADMAWGRLGTEAEIIADHGDDPLSALKRLCDWGLPLSDDEDIWIRVYAAAVFHSLEDPELGKALAQSDREGAPYYLDLIRACQDAGQIPKERDPEDVLAAIWAIEVGLLEASFSHPDYFTTERLRRVWDRSFLDVTS